MHPPKPNKMKLEFENRALEKEIPNLDICQFFAVYSSMINFHPWTTLFPIQSKMKCLEGKKTIHLAGSFSNQPKLWEEGHQKTNKTKCLASYCYPENISCQRISSYAAFAFDAYYAFLIAINSLLHQGNSASSIKGDLLLQTLLRTSFTGVSGDVSFDENTGDRMLSYELWNLQSSSSSLAARVVAEFSSALGNFTFRDGEEVTWMGGSKGKLPPASLSECNPGFFYSRMTRRCMPCQKGQYCQNNAIYLCERGNFSKESASVECTPCTPGSHAPERGLVECIPCSPGFVANSSGFQQCDRCVTGKYMNASGGTACTECGLGQTTTGVASTSSLDCRCEEGHFMCPSSGCMECPEGLNCTGVGAPEQIAGLFRTALSQWARMSSRANWHLFWRKRRFSLQ